MANIATVAPIPTFMAASTAAGARTAIGIYLTQTSTQTITLSGAYSLTLTMTGNTNVTLPTSGTLLSSSSKISDLASTTSAELAGKISDETGSGSLVFATSPTLITPVLGVATATSLNGMTVTASTGTFSLTNGKTFAVTNSVTLAGTDSTTITLPSSTSTLYGTATGSITSAQLKASLTDETGSGLAVFATAPSLSAPVITSGTITTGLTPTTNDGAALGTTTLAFSDLFLASGGVVNWDNGDVLFTHIAGAVVVGGGGDLRVTTAGTNNASVVTVAGSQTLSSKVLAAPTITDATISDATITNSQITSTAINQVVTERTTTGAVSISSGVIVLARAGSAFTGTDITVAAPSSQDGTRITFIGGTAFAHVVTFSGSTLLDGTAGANSTITFPTSPGASATVVAWGTSWLLESNNGCTIAP